MVHRFRGPRHLMRPDYEPQPEVPLQPPPPTPINPLMALMVVVLTGGLIVSVAVAFINLGRITEIEAQINDRLTGLQGKDGDQGIQGEKGEKGDTGEQGIQGVPGMAVNFPRLLRVDGMYGNDTTGAKGGIYPFQTINAALANATLGDVVFVTPGIYNETIVIPTGVTVTGLSASHSILQQTGVATPTTMVTMGERSGLRNMGILLSTATPVNVVGIAFPGTTSETASAENFEIFMNNTAGSVSSTIGVHSYGTGMASPFKNAIEHARISVNGGQGTTRGILSDTAAHHFHAREVIILASETTSAIGVEVNHASAELTLHSCSVLGTHSDVARTLGTLALASTDLNTPSANGKSFTVLDNPSWMTFGDTGSLPSTATRYFYPGTNTAGSNEIFVPIATGTIVVSMSVRYRIAAAAGRVDTYTVRKNGVNTALTLSITGPAASASVNTLSANFQAGDRLSLQVVTSSGSSPQDAMIVLGFN